MKITSDKLVNNKTELLVHECIKHYVNISSPRLIITHNDYWQVGKNQGMDWQEWPWSPGDPDELCRRTEVDGLDRGGTETIPRGSQNHQVASFHL